MPTEITSPISIWLEPGPYIIPVGTTISASSYIFHHTNGSASFTVTNAGTLTSDTYDIVVGGYATVINAATGVLNGGTAGAVYFVGFLTFTNYGITNGAVQAQLDSANYSSVTHNYGTIVDFKLDTVNDTINLYTGSSVTGTIDAGLINFDGSVDVINLRLDDRPTVGTAITGNNSGITTGTLARVANVEILNVEGGTWTLDDAQTYDMGINLSGGTLIATSTLTGQVTVTGGTLAGTGTVGAVTLTAGTLAPGNSPGILNTGNLSIGAGASFAVEIGGPTAGTDHDQANVTGTVTLAGTLSLALIGGYVPPIGTSFTLVENDSTDAVVGTFAGLAQGTTFAAGGQYFTISYTGGTGNDVVLTAAAPPPSGPPSFASSFDQPRVNDFAAGNYLLFTGSETAANIRIDWIASGDIARITSADGRSLLFSASALSISSQAGRVQFTDGSSLIVGDAAGNPLAGSLASDVLYGGPGDDGIDASQGGNDIIYGGAGADTIFAGAGNNHLYGGAATAIANDSADMIIAGAGNDYIQGNAGNDSLTGGEGSDRIFGGQGDDLILAEGGNDSINGNLGNDTIQSGAGNDLVRGGQGDDDLSDDSGNDQLFGDLGNDTLTGGEGVDILTGGDGADLFKFNAPDAAPGTGALAGFVDTITDFQVGVDRIQLAFSLAADDYLVPAGGAAFTSVAAAQVYAQQLLDAHASSAGHADVAAIGIGGDTYLFFNNAGGAAIDSIVKLTGLAPAALTAASFL